MPVYSDYHGEEGKKIVANRLTKRHLFVLSSLLLFYIASCGIERIFQSV